MKLEQVRIQWERFGELDALGAILTERDGEQGPWSVDRFLATGPPEIERIRQAAEGFGLSFGGARALDFGCGVGRLTRPLCERFERVDGVDVARSMLERAQALHGSGRVRWLHNDRADLGQLGDAAYDLVLSLITLQHLPPRIGARFIGEFFRVVRPGGSVFFQLPTRSHPSSERLLAESSLKQRALALLPACWLEAYRRARTGGPRMDMFGLPRGEVEGLIRAAGGELVGVQSVADAGDLLPSLRYFARRPGPSAD